MVFMKRISRKRPVYFVAKRRQWSIKTVWSVLQKQKKTPIDSAERRDHRVINNGTHTSKAICKSVYVLVDVILLLLAIPTNPITFFSLPFRE